MSNFQRTRSKVWWGDSPPNIGSPVAQPSRRDNHQGPREDDWEPQLPHWVPNQSLIEELDESPPLPAANVWPRRQSSPGSHKSQDSGFSDSDSSPPMNQQKEDKAEPHDADLSVAENRCCQAPEEINTTPKKDLNNAVLNYLQTPKNNIDKYSNTPIRSLIKTPKDVQDYLQAHCDIGHKPFDTVTCESTKKIVFTPKKMTNASNEKCEAKKNLLSKFEDYGDNGQGEVNSNIEYIQLSSSQQIAVNNQPRMRSPITRISYHVPVHYFKQNLSSESNINNQSNQATDLVNDCKAGDNFQRTNLNRSLDYGHQKLEEQILDDGPHSLSYIEVMQHRDTIINSNKDEIKSRALSHRKITDSLNLKTPKKFSSRTKQKIQSKSKVKHTPKIHKGFFNFLPKRHDSFKTIYDITRNSTEIDRVPSLGLPVYTSEEDINAANDDVSNNNSFHKYNDQCVESNKQEKSKSPRGILKTPGAAKITPPLQFQDTPHFLKMTKSSCSRMKRDIISDEIHFSDFEFNAYTSTPKTLPTKTPQTSCGKIRPVNLLSTFNESIKYPKNESISSNVQRNDIPQTALQRITNGQPAPLKHWLCELVGQYEPECMTTLQSKSIGVELNAKIENSSATITSNIRKVQTHGQIIAHQFNQLMTDLNNTHNTYHLKQHYAEINAMIANINEFVLAHSITLKIKPPGESPDRWDKIRIALQTNIQRVTEITDDIKIELNETRPEIDVLQRHLKTLLNIFVETARAVLVQQMKTLVSMLEEPPSDMILKSTLTSLSHLGALMTPEANEISDSDNEAMKFITNLPFIECGVPRALLSVIIESNKSSIKALSLRAITTICMTSEAVQQFDEAGGLEILSDILNEESNPEPQMREAVTVLTQITAPWLDGDYRIKELTQHLEIITKNLTGILLKTSCCQLLLLCTACLVNLVNMAKQNERHQLNVQTKDSQQCDIIQILTKYKTIENLLESVKQRGPNMSVFLQEQTATLINVISTSSRGQIMLAGCHATAVALVCFLRTPCASPARPARLQAEFRLVNQATEALARLCVLPEITIQVIQLEGVTRLVRVIQAQKTQTMDGKCSDQILVNCLRALRLIVKNHNDCFENIDCDISDMINPSLMESVKIYSAKQESYV